MKLNNKMKNIIRDKRYRVHNDVANHVTIKLMGKAIRNASSYLPIRNFAASIAAQAARKDYLGQLKLVWNEFLKRWRYVKDPHETETVTTSPRAIYNLILGHNGGVGRGLGAGDCDDAAVGLGAMLMSIGFPIRIATIAAPGWPGNGFTHVFIQAMIPGRGWINVDPVLVPQAGLGDVAPHGRIAIWDLKGNLIASKGIPLGVLKKIARMQRRHNAKRN